VVPWSFPLTFFVGLVLEAVMAWHRAKQQPAAAAQPASMQHFRTGDGS
jgi:delta 1-pyrroline-5-carboxylate dehydrogenase